MLNQYFVHYSYSQYTKYELYSHFLTKKIMELLSNFLIQEISQGVPFNFCFSNKNSILMMALNTARKNNDGILK